MKHHQILNPAHKDMLLALTMGAPTQLTQTVQIPWIMSIEVFLAHNFLPLISFYRLDL
jgi:hypothetical protein